MKTRDKRKNKMGRKNMRVDFTPMVDMNMLLITFFMFCTTLSKPQIMDVAMPTGDQSEIANTEKSKAITLILADANKMYYYHGTPDYEDYTSLKEISYSQLRNVLVEKNKSAVTEMNTLRTQFNAKSISEQEYKERAKEIKSKKTGITAVIKPTKDAVYQNLVNALDEMQICSIGKYAVVELDKSDDFLIENYKSKGQYAQLHSVNM